MIATRLAAPEVEGGGRRRSPYPFGTASARCPTPVGRQKLYPAPRGRGCSEEARRVARPRGAHAAPRFLSVFELADMVLCIELFAELLDQLQLRFQEVDMAFLVRHERNEQIA